MEPLLLFTGLAPVLNDCFLFDTEERAGAVLEMSSPDGYLGVSDIWVNQDEASPPR